MEPSRKAPNVQQTLVEPVGSGANAPLRFGGRRGNREIYYSTDSLLPEPPQTTLFGAGVPRGCLLADRARSPHQLTQRLEEFVEILAAAHLPGTGEVGHGGCGGGGGAKAAAGTDFCCGTATHSAAGRDWRSAPSRTRLESLGVAPPPRPSGAPPSGPAPALRAGAGRGGPTKGEHDSPPYGAPHHSFRIFPAAAKAARNLLSPGASSATPSTSCFKMGDERGLMKPGRPGGDM